jgi:formylglycine-generating enzyme required for sulfatase activity/predicted Ser/Thr protein kinase
MGEVWKAYHEQTNRFVAIKCLRRDYAAAPSLRQRFLVETRILSRLDHHRVVRVLHAFVGEDGEAYLVMQFIEGSTLEELLRRGVPLSRHQCLEWLRQVAEGLAYVHRQGILHRDIKPSNVIIDSSTFQARLIDFGIALSDTQEPRLTGDGGSPLTPEYASPEQQRGGSIDERSDLYSAALAVYHIWKRNLPSRRPDGSHDIRFSDDTPDEVQRLFLKCLATRPEERYGSAEAFLADLEGYLDGGRTLRSRPGRRLRPPARAWPVIVLAGVTVSVLIAWRLNRSTDRNMIAIPAGEAVTGVDPADLPEDLRSTLGSWKSLMRGGRRRVKVVAFWIDKYEVTNDDYARFVRATGARAPVHWDGSEPPPEIANHPVVNVTYADALAFARWARKRLPTALEWERAARGTEGFVYPWGREFSSERCNTLESGLKGTAPVDAFPRDVSPFGVVGMGGNVTEWTSTPMLDDESGAEGYAVAGGSWLELGEIVSLTPLRRLGLPDRAYSDVGFRCAK